jgi:hypothetical protein
MLSKVLNYVLNYVLLSTVEVTGSREGGDVRGSPLTSDKGLVSQVINTITTV